MKNFLFTIGLGVHDAPERWTAICAIYARLARGLKHLGHRCSFLVNPSAHDASALHGLSSSPADHDDLQREVAVSRPDFCFIWGGRIPPDLHTLLILRQHNVTPVFSELGWFPQRGTIYFDLNGTNAKMSPPPAAELSVWARSLFHMLRRNACRSIYGRQLNTEQPALRPKKIFVPLQDEKDTNILQDSPFLKMDDMLKHLSVHYPEAKFITRIHPKACSALLSEFPNVTIQSPQTDPYAALPSFDLVVGINSTLISEAVFLGHPAMCFGNGIAATYGLATKLNPREPPPELVPAPESLETRTSLAYLFLHKQLNQRSLSSPRYLMRSYLRQMLKL
jgi:hypothetical protein